MWINKRQIGLILLLSIALLEMAVKNATAQFVTLNSTDWINYKDRFGKNYANRAMEMYAIYNYNYNSKLIAMHNQLYARGLRTYGLAVNQFSDMRLAQYNALFPIAVPLSESFGDELPLLPTTPAPDNFDPRNNFGLNVEAQNQGVSCSSGWAYATAKAIELMNAYPQGNLPINEHVLLSAQNLIDCAGQGKGCGRSGSGIGTGTGNGGQVPQMALDYLTQYDQPLHLEVDYRNQPERGEQGMCVPPVASPTLAQVHVSSYAHIPDGNDAMLQRYVSSYPAVIEFNPTSFEFMHYAEGIFQPPLRSSGRGSHFMTVIGYGTGTATNANTKTFFNNNNNNNNQQVQQDYWWVLNSFGNDWGEQGFIRIARSTVTPLAKSTILPTMVTSINRQ